jgi:AraC-like DNA-binding protein
MTESRPDPAPPAETIALRTSLRYVSKIAPVTVGTWALRRPEVVLRHTKYEGLVVDERLLTRAFPWMASPARFQALVVTGGSVRRAGEHVSAGDVVLITPEEQSTMRFESTSHLEIEWDSPHAAAHTGLQRLGRLRSEDAERLEAMLVDERAPQRETFRLALRLVAEVGAPLDGLTADGLTGGPSERDIRIAAALAETFSNLATAADTLHLTESAKISTRQLQRVLAAFGEKYGMGIESWRDLRNRWRVQVAAVLFSRPELTASAVAAEVGYASAPALARAFAKAGLPSPTEVRRRLLEEAKSSKVGRG